MKLINNFIHFDSKYIYIPKEFKNPLLYDKETMYDLADDSVSQFTKTLIKTLKSIKTKINKKHKNIKIHINNNTNLIRPNHNVKLLLDIQITLYDKNKYVSEHHLYITKNYGYYNMYNIDYFIVNKHCKNKNIKDIITLLINTIEKSLSQHFHKLICV